MAETGPVDKLPPAADNSDEGWNQVVNEKARRGQLRLEKAKDDKAKKKGFRYWFFASPKLTYKLPNVNSGP